MTIGKDLLKFKIVHIITNKLNINFKLCVELQKIF